VVTKRSQLIDKGWPATALLIAMARVPSGEMHAVLVVVTDKGELVLDNLRSEIVSWRALPIAGTASCRQASRDFVGASSHGFGTPPKPSSV